MGVRTGAQVAQIEQLRARMQRLERRTSVVDAAGMGRSLPTHEALAEVARLRVGGTYATESLTLALALLAGPSAAGEWTAIVGVEDLGIEAAAELGVDLERTICVPRPQESWLEATAALIDVVTLVLVRPTARVTPSVAEKIEARLRTRDAALVALGDWPRADVRLAASEPRWMGAGRGEGYLRSRRLVVEAVRGAGPVRRTTLRLPAEDGGVVISTSSMHRSTGSTTDVVALPDLQELEVG